MAENGSVNFKNYYFSNMGKLYKAFEINVNNHNFHYDIYWGDPDIIFDVRDSADMHPLAVTIIPQRKNYPNSRIFIHEKLGLEFKNEFEIVLAHEIGHLWLHDVVGVNHQMTNTYMKESETEVWADYFAFRVMDKYREMNSFYYNFEKISALQIQFYDIADSIKIKNEYVKKAEDLKKLAEDMITGLKSKNQLMIHMNIAIEMTLAELDVLFV